MALPQIVDGFSYNTSLLYLQSGRFWPNALAQLDVLRRAANYRARWWIVPDDENTPIAPYDTLYYQLEVSAGSYLWGYQFINLTEGELVSNNDLLVEAVDSCTGIPLFMDFASGGGLHSDFTARCVPIILTQPRLLLEPGLVNVEISNHSGADATCQILMLFAEPCRVITEEDRAREWARMPRAAGGHHG